MPTKSQPTGDLVVLTHGICSSKWLVLPLARRLRGRGYETRLWSYPTLRGSNKDLGARFADYLSRLADEHPNRTIHVVAHSMGSIVTRCAALAGLPPTLGRIVMLAPPNRGSHVARLLVPVYGWFCTTLVELSDDPNSFVNKLPRTLDGHEVGVIAVTRDNVVQLPSTYLDNHADHVVVDTWHTGVLWLSQTASLVDTFLQSGQFAAAPQLATA
jgi:pimeloyl-ACP methyl ester carboxylesterase